MTQDDIIAASTAALAGQPGLKALFLGGSFGAGLADAYSDVDLVAVAEDAEAAQALAARWEAAIGARDPVMHRMARPAGFLLVNLVTEGWHRADLHLRAGLERSGYGQDGLTPLHDPGDLLSGLPPRAPQPDRAARLDAIVREFVRVQGLAIVGLGRGELVIAASGIHHLRTQLIALFTLITAAPHQGGILHLSRLVSDDQMAVLAALPAPRADRAQVIDANLAYAHAFAPSARSFAAEIDADWPARFWNTTFAMLADRLDPRFGALVNKD